MASKELLQAQFTDATDELLRMLQSLTQEELNTVPFEGSWTAGQLGEHLLRAYGVTEVLKGAVEPTQRPPDQKVEEVKQLFLDFNIKMKSPQAVLPQASTNDKNKLIPALKIRVEEMAEVLENYDLSMTCKEFAIPEYGPFTRLEWLWFNTIHTQRHIHQLKNIVKSLRVVTPEDRK
ncbi:hypothetical protein C900_01268 [Fulvivirga imtechensis AK7]|uniref:DinB-like domain-containing protein n=1 Tax=Fulvivirga imtechensis AK7 TaxID=1237149 RepID=L8JGR0_9BACT|nr:DinB family protein [Fulvivirga imtechensis]ELR68005.1 hypothetical protein C900_01268 [Fulvivirga imtechensis AK7]